MEGKCYHSEISERSSSSQKRCRQILANSFFVSHISIQPVYNIRHHLDSKFDGGVGSVSAGGDLTIMKTSIFLSEVQQKLLTLD